MALKYRESSNPTIPPTTTVKNQPLTNIEVDANFKSLDNDIATTQSAVIDLGTNKVSKTSAVGSAGIPAGTTAERDALPAAGYTRFNTTLNQYEGYNGTSWTSIGGGATGAPGNYVFIENDQVVTGNYTIGVGKNAVSAGPITVDAGVVVTVPSGAAWTIV